jgi:hypothetical protein
VYHLVFLRLKYRKHRKTMVMKMYSVMLISLLRLCPDDDMRWFRRSRDIGKTAPAFYPDADQVILVGDKRLDSVQLANVFDGFHALYDLLSAIACLRASILLTSGVPHGEDK